jgi:hypothetical protein
MYIDTLNGKDTENSFQEIFNEHVHDIQRAELCSRYANVLLSTNFESAIEKIKISYKFIASLENQTNLYLKQIEKIKLQHAYYMMLKDEKNEQLERLIAIAKKMTFANSRRKFFLTFAPLAAIQGKMALSKFLLEVELNNIRNEGRKFCFYLASANAVYKVKNDNIRGAIKELEGFLMQKGGVAYFDNIIKHNLSTLRAHQCSNSLKVEILKSLDFQKGVFYIEPRGER